MSSARTLKAVREELARADIQIRYSSAYNEYRVNLKGGREATAYYTTDLDDARDTGLYMAYGPGRSV